MWRVLDWMWRFPWMGERPPVVPVLTFHGAIGAVGGMRQTLSIGSLAGQIERAFETKGAKAVALVVNSPGGSPVQSMLIHKRIVALAKEKGLPVIAFAEDVAASGGYVLALAADEILIDEASIVGSIGVVSASFGFTGLMERLGIERRLHASGTRKAMLDPFQPERAEDVARLKDIQAEVHETFKALVRARRGDRLKADEAELFNGDVWVGGEAVRRGIADGIGDLRSTLRARFGKRVKLRFISGPRMRLRVPFVVRAGGAPAPRGLAFDLVAALELRALWARFGL